MLEDYKVSRKIGKALTLPAAPAFSFGSRHEQPKGNIGPGPGAYDPEWSRSSRGTGFGTSARSSWQVHDTPAGASYKPSVGQVNASKPVYSFGIKHKQDPDRQVPGPGTYEPNPSEKLVKPSSSVYTLAPRTVGDGDPERSPGPAEYSPEFKPREPHAASIKFRNEVPHKYAQVTPGPGEYNSRRPPRPYSEGKTFGASRTELLRNNGVPGPGEYGAPPMEPQRPRRASWTIGRASRDAGHRAPANPGPGAYEIIEPLINRDGGHSAASDYRSPPAYTFGGRPPWAAPALSPGPADYGAPPEPGRNTKPVYTLRGAAPKEHDEMVPGPGTYAPDRADEKVHTTAPVYSIAQRPSEPVGEVQPGPGSYDPRDGDPGRIAVSLKFRTDPKPPTADHPAPHDYASKDFKGFGVSYGGSQAHKGFTMRPRWREERRDRVPGPQYAVGCSTLGVASAPTMEKTKISVSLVL